MSQNNRDLIMVIGVGADKYSKPEIFFLPMEKVKDYLIDELESQKEGQWRDVYQFPCDCRSAKCVECRDIRDMKKNGLYTEANKNARKAWRLFDKIAFEVKPGHEIPGRIVKYYSYKQ
jgi:hypothetical protein